MTININYALGPEARKFVARATSALSLPKIPASSTLPYLPQRGDEVRWDAISNSVKFVVENRVFRFGINGDLDIDLQIECDPQP